MAEAFASSSASNSKELDELNYKHEWSEEDLNLLLKEQMDKAQAATAEMEALRAELKNAQTEAEQQRATSEKSNTELSEERDARRKDQARILEVEQDLKGLYAERDVLQADKKNDAAELKRLELAHNEAQVQARSDREELRQVSEIAAGTFVDLPRSAADACQYFNEREDAAEQKAFWAQFQVSSHPPLLGDQMKQLMELHRVARPVMEDLCNALWPAEPLPSSYFGLIQRLRSASPRVQLWKRSACLEGARQAYASVKAYYPVVKPEEMAKGAPEGTKRVPEQYFNDVMPGARLSEAKCRKDTILEDLE
ncbi:uncharacterized protein [Aegilops tauschii subsp. strangulata]|uniref:uncharacterized protein n=1 Tax=Aegilops tauschii subsp. strangulata TaxID=200361 RepID=UPI003CC89C72